MDKESLWKLYVSKNPLLPRTEWARRMFDTTYDAAHKEVAVGLDCNGVYCDPDSPECISVGHLDFAWVVEVDGAKVAYVGDLKRTEWAATDGPRSVQLMAYLLAWASLHGCDQGAAGLWYLTDGEWHWGELIDLGVFSDEAAKLRELVVAAALNVEGDYAMGPHCNGCYGRLHCPAYLMPPEMAETTLAPFAEPGAVLQLSDEERGALALNIKRAEDTIDKAKESLKAASRQGARVVAGDKQWKECQMPGRAGFDSKRLEAEQPEIAKAYRTVGKPYGQFKWVKS